MLLKKVFMGLVSLGISCGFPAMAHGYSQVEPQKQLVEQSDLYKYHLQKLKIRSVVAENSLYDSRVLDIYESFTGAIEDRYLIQKLYSEEDVQKILLATEFAAKKHKGQKRKNKEKTPYISHPMSVAYQIMDIAKVFDPDIIVAALLHDTLEDTNATEKDIEHLFGSNVCSIVKEVTDDPELTSEQQKLQQVFKAPHLSKGAALVKTSDRLHNLKEAKMSFWSEEKVTKYFTWGKRLAEKLPRVNEVLIQTLEKEIESYFENFSDSAS